MGNPGAPGLAHIMKGKKDEKNEETTDLLPAVACADMPQVTAMTHQMQI